KTTQARRGAQRACGVSITEDIMKMNWLSAGGCALIVTSAMLTGCVRLAPAVKPAPRPAPDVEREVLDILGDKKPATSDCPMFGGTPQRNMVNTVDKNVPTQWSIGDVDEKKSKKPVNIKWVA